METQTKKFAIVDNFWPYHYYNTAFGFGIKEVCDEYVEDELPQKILYAAYDPDTSEYETIECELNCAGDAYSAPDEWGFDEYVAHVVEL